MKKLLLLTAGLLVLAAPVAFADGYNLAWGVCRTAANNLTASTNNFTLANPADCTDPANDVTNRRLVCSFKNSTPYLGWQGTTVRVDFLTAGPVSDWWNVAPGGCRDGALAAPTVLVNGSGCTNPYVLTPLDPAGQSEFSSISVDAANGRIRYDADHVRNTTAVDLPVPTSAGGYTADNLALDMAPSVSACQTDCAQPASIALNFLQYFGPGDTPRNIAGAELNPCITYGGGAAGGCPGAVPTRNVTWGHVKQLYR